MLSRRRSRTGRREARLRVTPCGQALLLVTPSGQALLADCQALLKPAAAEFPETLSEAQARCFLRIIAAPFSANS